MLVLINACAIILFRCHHSFSYHGLIILSFCYFVTLSHCYIMALVAYSLIILRYRYARALAHCYLCLGSTWLRHWNEGESNGKEHRQCNGQWDDVRAF